MKLLKENLFLLLLFFIFSFVLYVGLFKVFFQQDEWYAFGQVLYANKAGISHLIQISGFHFAPLASFFVYLFYNLFKLNYIYYALLGIVLHSFNSFLVYLLALRLSGEKKISILSGVLFLFASTPDQAVSWYAVIFSVLPATLFSVTSLLTFFKFIEKGKYLYLFTSLVLLLGSLGFKEDAILLFGLFSIYLLISFGRKSVKGISFVLLSILLYLGVRVFVTIASPHIVGIAATKNYYQYLIIIIQHAILFPLEGFSQLLIQPTILLSLGREIVSTNTSLFVYISPISNLELFIENYIVPTIAIFTSFSILLMIAGILLKNNILFSRKKVIILSLIFILCGFLPVSFLPQGLGLESRHFYFPMVGGSILFSVVFFIMYDSIKNKAAKTYILLLVIIYIALNWFLISNNISFLQQLSTKRIQFIAQLQKTYNSLPQKVIFYATGDDLPLQSGPGQLFLVLYDGKQSYEQFLKNNYLWDMSNGYKEINNIGFGFFYDKKLMLDAYENFHLTPKNVYSFRWDEKKEKLFDISTQVRNHLYEKNK